MNITLYGASSDRIDPVYMQETEALGRLLARNGHTLVYGGVDAGLGDVQGWRRVAAERRD